MHFTDILESLEGDGDQWRAQVPDSWLQGRTAFGGLQAALGLAAMRRVAGTDVPLRVLQTTFVAPVPGGEVSLQARRLRAGKSVTHAAAELLVDGATACIQVGIFGGSRASELRLDAPAPPALPRPETLVDLPFAPGITPEFTRQFGFRWADGTPPFTGARQGRTRIYIRHRQPAPRLDEAQVVALTDAIPSPALSMLTKPAMASSLTWTLEMLAPIPAVDSEAWWLIDTEITAARDGYVNMTGLLYAPDGQAVVLTRQSVVVFG
ncbi:MAG TPA: thioesterase family protein [Candidatus Binatia bacterium]|nr:thioesterase family protein [Candidatus Binatia bacterium]